MMAKVKSCKLVDFFFKRSWWVFLLFLFSFIFYCQSIKVKNREIYEHKKKLSFLEKKKNIYLRENEDLNLMINSLSDPAWVEIVLMRDLGMVPEGKIKVHFTSKN